MNRTLQTCLLILALLASLLPSAAVGADTSSIPPVKLLSFSAAQKVYLPLVLTPPGPPVAPAAPSGLALTPVSQSGIDVRWLDNSNNETSFEIERAPVNTTSFVKVGTVGANVEVYQDRGLTKNTGYAYRVRARNEHGASAYTAAQSASTLNGLPAAPTNLKSLGVTSNSATLAWTDNSADETGFELEQSLNGSTFTVIAGTSVLKTDMTVVNVTSLTPSTTYYYRVRAKNANGYSAYTNTLSVHTSADQTPTLRINNGCTDGDFLISLEINGQEFLPTWQDAIGPGGYVDFTLEPGNRYIVTVMTGYWDTQANPAKPIGRYIWSWEVNANLGDKDVITVTDPTIQQLLTNFSQRRYWVGDFWDNTTYGYAAFCFYENGRYRNYWNGQQIGTGTYSMVDYGSISTRFKIRDDDTSSLEGLLDGINGNARFFLDNGPATWKKITYILQSDSTTAQKCPSNAP